MPRKPSSVQKIVAQRKTICKECGKEIYKGEELWLVGTAKRVCLSCYVSHDVSSTPASSPNQSMIARRTKGIIMFDPEHFRPRRKRKGQVTIRTKRMTLEPKYDEEGKLICPRCNSQKDIRVVSYDYNDRIAKYYFLWECKTCKVQFEENLDKI